MAKTKFFEESEVSFVEKPNQVQFQDLGGQKFGRLTVIGYAGKTTLSNWFCRCDCGNITKVVARSLKSGDTKSCGCFRVEFTTEAKKTHGYAKKGHPSLTHRVWNSMKNRCQNPNNPAYDRYGGRGIKVCESWQSFENFLADMGEKPEGLTLERKENDKGYYKENCKWATRKEQQNNRRNNRFLTLNGKTQTLAQWENELALNKGVIRKRLISGWPVEKALTNLKL